MHGIPYESDRDADFSEFRGWGAVVNRIDEGPASFIIYRSLFAKKVLYKTINKTLRSFTQTVYVFWFP